MSSHSSRWIVLCARQMIAGHEGSPPFFSSLNSKPNPVAGALSFAAASAFPHWVFTESIVVRASSSVGLVERRKNRDIRRNGANTDALRSLERKSLRRF